MQTKLREAKQILDEKGWIKGDYENLVDDAHPRGYCLVGAIGEVLGTVALAESGLCTESNLLLEVIKEQYPDRCLHRATGTDYFDIPTFNDHEDTTRADIDLVLEKAIARADETVD